MLIHYIFLIGIFSQVFNKFFTSDESQILNEATNESIRYIVSVTNSSIFIPQSETQDECNDLSRTVQNSSCYVRWLYVCGPYTFTGPALIRSSPFTTLNEWKFELSDPMCNRQDTQLVVRRENTVFTELNFDLANLGHNQLLTHKKSSPQARNDMNVDILKWCHNLRGNKCQTVCRPPSPTHRCRDRTGEIICADRYSGADCSDSIINYCNVKVCMHNSDCIQTGADYRCICTKGYTGRHCEIKLPTLSICYNGVIINGEPECKCMNNVQSPDCRIINCPPTYCLNGGTCVASHLSWECKCPTSFAGRRCQHQCFHDCVRGVCVLSYGKPVCQCDKFFSGEACNVPFTPSQDRSIKCLHNGVTISGKFLLGYICQCTSSWKGYSCEFPVCNPGNCLNGVCVLGNSKCYCTAGYTGEQCEILNCNSLNICQNGGICIQASLYDVRCSCPNGFTGRYCEQACPGGCGTTGICVTTTTGYQCQCDPNHEGANCEMEKRTTSCGRETCNNGGTCILASNPRNGSLSERFFECRCTPYWTGPSCSIPACSVSTCTNGQCLQNVGCVCNKGFSGLTCDSPSCSSDFCLNGGQCNTLERSHQCICNPLVSSGPRCENVCPSGCSRGECVTAANGEPVCKCINGFSGRSCQFEDFSLPLTYAGAAVLAFSIIFMICGLGVFGYSKFFYKKSKKDLVPQVEIESPYLYQGL